jgi:choline monooxygenase
MLTEPDRTIEAGSPWAVVEENAARLEEKLTPTPEWYLDPAVYELELERVFAKTWQLVCPVTDVDEPGSYTTVRTDSRREFVIVRDLEGKLRAYYNVCPHRGNLLVGGQRQYAAYAPPTGTTQLFTCLYHAWSFNLDGSLRRAPGLDGLDNFAPTDFSLSEVSVDTWGPLVFLNPDPNAPPLSEHLGALPETVQQLSSGLGFDLLALAKEGNFKVVEGVLECNWKTAVENSLECYHCASSHPGFADTVDLPKWQITLRGNCIIQGTRAKHIDMEHFDERRGGRMGPLTTAAALSTEGTDSNYFHWIFPNNSVSFWPGPTKSFNVARWIPDGPERTRWWSVRWWAADVPDEIRDEQWQFLSDVGWEDKEIVENTHIGMRSGAWRGGPFYVEPDVDAPVENPMPHVAGDELQQIRDERGIHLFNRLVANTLVG